MTVWWTLLAISSILWSSVLISPDKTSSGIVGKNESLDFKKKILIKSRSLFKEKKTKVECLFDNTSTSKLGCILQKAQWP